MNAPALLSHAAELYRIIIKSSQPAEDIASAYLRGRKQLNRTERRDVSEAVFAALRLRLAAEWCAADPARLPVPHQRVVAAAGVINARLADTDAPLSAVFDRSWNDAVLAARDVLEADARRLLARHAPLSSEEEEMLSAWASFPRWLLDAISAGAGRRLSDAAVIAAGFRTAAPLCIRAALDRVPREAIIASLAADGITGHAGRHAPGAIVLDERVRITELDAFRVGLFEVQDEGSQLVAYAVAAKAGDRILDACAGAGGKTLHLADLTHDRADIVVTDVERSRLRALAQRVRRCGYRSIRIARPEDILAGSAARPQESFDAVLVDAPCSGLGTARRSPMMKWRLTPSMLERITRKQRTVLTRYATLVRPGGVLVYATCSILPQENEEIVAAFLDAHPGFSAEPLAPVFEADGVTLPDLRDDDWCVTVHPARHGTDGFFIARLRRSGA